MSPVFIPAFSAGDPSRGETTIILLSGERESSAPIPENSPASWVLKSLFCLGGKNDVYGSSRLDNIPVIAP